ncbi:MAG: hypothetical protein JSW38_04515 [Dehalococcoidia bacterium]|nr:MAG: hypothetical protein JSW38_04515 [Dehalococcoidia bacterium]
MPELNITTINKAKRILKDERVIRLNIRKKSPIMQEYEGYLMKLDRGKAITMTLKDGENYQTIKYRLKNAAQSLGLKNLKIERAADKIIFYKEVNPRPKKSALQRRKVRSRREDQVESERMIDTDIEQEIELETDIADESVDDTDLDISQDMESTDEQISDEITAPVVELLEFEFDEEWEMPMVYGHKTCETETQPFAGTGFEAFGHQYVVTKVEQLLLKEVQQKWFKQHGLFSPREFQEVWKQRHKGSFDPEQKVWMHHFKRGFAPPPEPETDLGADLDQD